MHTNLPNELETFINKYNDYKKKEVYNFTATIVFIVTLKH